MIRNLSKLFIFVAYLLLCSSPATGHAWNIVSASKPFRGQTIQVSLISGYERNKLLLEKLIPEFEKKTGINVKISFVSYNDVLDEHKYIFSSKSSKYDLLNVDNIYFPIYVDHLESIEEMSKDRSLGMPNFQYDDFIPELLEGYSWDKKIYCIPETFEAPILMIRKDLFEKAGLVDADGKIVPPRNIQEYYEYAKKLTQDVNGDGITDIYGTTLQGSKTGIFDEIVSFYWGDGGEIFDSHLKPVINNETMLNVLHYYQEIYVDGYAPPESRNWELGEAATAFRLGKVAMSWNWSMVAPWILDPKISKVADKTIFINLFKNSKSHQRYLREASTALCIPKYAINKKAAFLFVQWITSPDNQMQYMDEKYHTHPSRRSILLSKNYAQQVSYAAVQRDIINSGSIRLAPKIRDYPMIDQIGAIQLQQVMIGQLSPERAILNIQKNIFDFMSSHNYYETDKEYSRFFSGIYP